MKASSVVWLLGFSLVGCTAKNSAYEKQLAQLSENIMILQNERDRLEERIAVLEQQRPGAESPRPGARGTVDRPQLRVVELRPPEEALNEAAPIGAPQAEPVAMPGTEERTLIQGSGSSLSQSPVKEGAMNGGGE
jgi:hypothetical protein